MYNGGAYVGPTPVYEGGAKAEVNTEAAPKNKAPTNPPTEAAPDTLGDIGKAVGNAASSAFTAIGNALVPPANAAPASSSPGTNSQNTTSNIGKTSSVERRKHNRKLAATKASVSIHAMLYDDTVMTPGAVKELDEQLAQGKITPQQRDLEICKISRARFEKYRDAWDKTGLKLAAEGMGHYLAGLGQAISIAPNEAQSWEFTKDAIAANKPRFETITFPKLLTGTPDNGDTKKEEIETAFKTQILPQFSKASAIFAVNYYDDWDFRTEAIPKETLLKGRPGTLLAYGKDFFLRFGTISLKSELAKGPINMRLTKISPTQVQIDVQGEVRHVIEDKYDFTEGFGSQSAIHLENCADPKLKAATYMQTCEWTEGYKGSFVLHITNPQKPSAVSGTLTWN